MREVTISLEFSLHTRNVSASDQGFALQTIYKLFMTSPGPVASIKSVHPS